MPATKADTDDELDELAADNFDDSIPFGMPLEQIVAPLSAEGEYYAYISTPEGIFLMPAFIHSAKKFLVGPRTLQKPPPKHKPRARKVTAAVRKLIAESSAKTTGKRQQAVTEWGKEGEEEKVDGNEEVIDELQPATKGRKKARIDLDDVDMKLTVYAVVHVASLVAPTTSSGKRAKAAPPAEGIYKLDPFTFSPQSDSFDGVVAALARVAKCKKNHVAVDVCPIRSTEKKFPVLHNS